MTNLSHIGKVVAISAWQEPTQELRWLQPDGMMPVHARLQQRWRIVTNHDSKPHSMSFEWRDVPIILESQAAPEV